MKRWMALALAFAFAGAAFAGTARAGGDQQRLVDRAQMVVDEMRGDPNFASFNKLLAKARGVVIVPELVKAGFILGGEGGTGVLLGRDPKTGAWSYPAFMTMASASFGLQIGAQVSKVVLLVMTDGGFDKLLSDKVTLGADANVTAGPVGAGVEAAVTTNVDADIYSYAHTKGLFGGISLEGAVLVPDEEWDELYYGKAVSTRAIVVDHAVSNPGADRLRAALAAD